MRLVNRPRMASQRLAALLEEFVNQRSLGAHGAEGTVGDAPACKHYSESFSNPDCPAMEEFNSIRTSIMKNANPETAYTADARSLPVRTRRRVAATAFHHR